MIPPPLFPTPRPLTRRRVLTIMGAAGATLPLSGAGDRSGSRMPTLEWRGRALGGPARIVIRHADESIVRALISHCVREIDRLDAIFSLYRADSEIARLNRDGIVTAPSLDFRVLMADARRYGALSDGVFDVTMQPLWRLYRRHFTLHRDDGLGPGARAIADAASLVDYRRIDLDRGRIRLARPGMAVSLNGIAQGYLTDRIADMLRDAGMSGVLVDLGEIRVIAEQRGVPWRIGIENPLRPAKLRDRVTLTNGAVATSGGYGTRFDAAGRYHHLFDPATGHCPSGIVAATAIAATATVADALATSLAVSAPQDAQRTLRAFAGRRAHLTLSDGTKRTIEA